MGIRNDVPLVFWDPMPISGVIFPKIALLVYKVAAVCLVQKHLLDAGGIPCIRPGSAGIPVFPNVDQPLVSWGMQLREIGCYFAERDTFLRPVKDQADIGGYCCIDLQLAGVVGISYIAVCCVSPAVYTLGSFYVQAGRYLA